MKKILVAFVTFFCISALGHTKTSLDVNDVSFLFPRSFNNIGKPYPALPLSEKLISQQVFIEILNFLDTPTEKNSSLKFVDSYIITKRANWYITAARYEACSLSFNHNPPKADAEKNSGQCIPRIRVVAQPYNEVTGKLLTTALHLLYSLDEYQKKKIEEGLFRLKDIAMGEYGIDTTGLTLAVHPVLKKAIKFKNDSYIEALNDGLLNFASKDNLEVLTGTFHTQINVWKFIGGIVQGNQWTSFQDRKVETFSCDMEDSCSSNDPYYTQAPSPSELQDFNKLAYILKTQHTDIQKKPTTEIKIIAENIDNTVKTNFFNTDCTSCHVSTKLRDTSKLLTNINFPEGITPFVLPKYRNNLLSDVINFGYSRNTPKISLRAAAESADVADQVNKSHSVESGNNKMIEDFEKFWICINQMNTEEACLNDLWRGYE